MFLVVLPSSVPSFIGSKIIVACVCSNSSISRRISLKFFLVMYLGKVYPLSGFGDAAPSVPSFIGSKVIFG